MGKTTVSLIKADVGSVPGHAVVHEKILETERKALEEAKRSGLLIDYYVTNCGDDSELIMTHREGVDSPKIHKLAWDAFIAAANAAKELHLYGAGQDLLKDAFSGNVKGMGPGVAEMEFTERRAEPVLFFMMDKTEPGAFNLPTYKCFADPFNTAGLVIDSSCHAGFRFEIWDIIEHKKVFMECPAELYDMLALVGAKSRYVIKRVYPKPGGKLPENEPVACISTDKLYQIAGEYVGKDDPVGVFRAQSGLPAVGEVLEAFSFPHLVSGWMRGSHNGPLMPVAQKNAKCTRFDGPPRLVCLGFQLADGKLVGPTDMFDDPVYDFQRKEAAKIADYMRRHGPFEPHRLPPEDMEYTTLPKVLKGLEPRFKKIE
ncbi:MAG: fructose-1,6-bisphosphate aldolase/phosphatase [Candidatus ainarchaeum sp.]|nr:fructose-1,6-bisphosphate aldolase/phosphatase [Candidatus ainarchaeum sp.]